MCVFEWEGEKEERGGGGEKVCATDVTVRWCIDVHFTRVWEKHLCNYFFVLLPCPPFPLHVFVKCVELLKDRCLKITVNIIVNIILPCLYAFSVAVQVWRSGQWGVQPVYEPELHAAIPGVFLVWRALQLHEPLWPEIRRPLPSPTDPQCKFFCCWPGTLASVENRVELVISQLCSFVTLHWSRFS